MRAGAAHPVMQRGFHMADDRMADDPEAHEVLPVIGGDGQDAFLPVLPSCRGYVSTCRGQQSCMALRQAPAQRDGLGDGGGAVCPEAAFAVPVEPLSVGGKRRLRGFASCAASAGASLDGLIGGAVTLAAGVKGEAAIARLAPCLDCFGLEVLAQLYRYGLRELVIARPPCESACSRDAPLLAARLSSFNGLLAPGGADCLRLVELSPLEWRRRCDRAGSLAPAGRDDRRPARLGVPVSDGESDARPRFANRSLGVGGAGAVG